MIISILGDLLIIRDHLIMNGSKKTCSRYNFNWAKFSVDSRSSRYSVSLSKSSALRPTGLVALLKLLSPRGLPLGTSNPPPLLLTFLIYCVLELKPHSLALHQISPTTKAR